MQPIPTPKRALKRYIVGGAVRDGLLGRPIKDRDWLVLGETPKSMIDAGFLQVGRDFPVYLHPETGEEHALARTERKTGMGYRGFSFDTSSTVTAEEDLLRRDLTINAIAQAEDGSMIDPYGGMTDLESRVLRHVSPAFAEDPLRVLRVARFAAALAEFGFTVHQSTLELMRGMVAAGEVDTLTPERVWKETERALDCARPSIYFNVLHDCGALARIMPEVAAMSGVPQRADHHPEVDTLVHVLMCVDQAAKAGYARDVRTAVLLHDLGKAITPPDEWPSHREHESRGVPLTAAFCDRMRVSTATRTLALLVTEDHVRVHRALEMRTTKVLEVIDRLGAFRAPMRFEQALQACESDARGRLGLEDRAYPQADYLRQAAEAARGVQPAEVVEAGYQGAAIGEQIRRRRLTAIAARFKELGQVADAPVA